MNREENFIGSQCGGEERASWNALHYHTMASSTYCVLILLAFAAYDQSFVEALCPTSQQAGEAEMKRCLSSVGLGGKAYGAGGGEDVSQLRQYCSDDSLDRALTCVQGILDDCKASNAQMGDTLAKVISVDKLRLGFKYMCDNVDVLVDNSKCIAQAAEPMSACVQAETQKFQAEVQVRMQSGQLAQEDVWQMTCGFLDRVFACQNTAYQACGDKVAEVITTFMKSMKPPICSDDSSTTPIISKVTKVMTTAMQSMKPSVFDDYSSATSIITNSWLMFSALFFIILLHLRS